MSALEIAAGLVAHFLLGMGIMSQIRARTDEAFIVSFVLLCFGIFGASYLWARVAGFA